MAISKNTKNKYEKYSSPYQESNSLINAKNKLAQMANRSPELSNNYETQLKDMYGKIKSGKPFSYNPDNDAAYRRFADEYNALAGLAIEGNQQQAQGLTGGYGSTYAPEVASQGLQRLREGAENAMPLFMEQAQKAYMANSDADINALNAGISARKDEINDYANRANAYNNQYDMAQKVYSDSRDFDYSKYTNNREYWAKEYQQEQEQANKEAEYQLQIYDTYNKLAANKCADYADKKNNSGMKAYLNGLVKEGKLTKYMADNLYKQYKYTAPSRGGSGGRSSRSSSVESSSGTAYDDMFKELYNNSDNSNNKPWYPSKEQILSLGYGPISDEYLTKLINSGEVILDVQKKTIKRTEPKTKQSAFKLPF
ncbi:MAG: hypothetical protein IJ731_09025 [Eubacterium sp.]|nr:hypothetical protein [Eubacterium sp.]